MRMTRTTRTQDKDGDGDRDKGGYQDVDNEGHWKTRRDEYKGNRRTTRTQDEDTTIKNRIRTMRDDNDEG